jgi:hypothetical protein
MPMEILDLSRWGIINLTVIAKNHDSVSDKCSLFADFIDHLNSNRPIFYSINRHYRKYRAHVPR